MESVVPYETKRLAIEEEAMSVENVIRQVSIIHHVMEKLMKQDEHYGTIPGTKKPSLFKPGAEKLGMTFRFAPEYQITRYDLPNMHREYEIVCKLTSINTGKFIGAGVGNCNTMEGKYRFRTGEVESTGKPVPKDYWNDRDQALIGGKGFSVKKIDGKWEIVRAGEKVEHDNPPDYYNTVLKMAKKRAFVDAILTATAASDIFTQDVEDMPEVINLEPKEKESSKKSKTKKDDPNNFDFLKIMGDFKKDLNFLTGSDEMYYNILGGSGYQKSNEIKDRNEQIAVYRAMEAKIKELKANETA